MYVYFHRPVLSLMAFLDNFLSIKKMEVATVTDKLFQMRFSEVRENFRVTMQSCFEWTDFD